MKSRPINLKQLDQAHDSAAAKFRDGAPTASQRAGILRWPTIFVAIGGGKAPGGTKP